MRHPKTCAAFILPVIFLCVQSRAQEPKTPGARSGHQPKYIFYFIGDGMASAQIHAAEAYRASLEDKEAVPAGMRLHKLALAQLPVLGMQMSYARDRLITDSAAAATALACGTKADVGVLSLHPDLETPCRTVAEMAQSKGMKVGIVTSVSLDHATPAAFYAHVRSRTQYREIGRRLIGSGFDYFAGGGFLDMPDLAEIAFEAGYLFARSRAEFAGLKPGEGKAIAVNPTTDRNQALPYALDRMSGGGPAEAPEEPLSLAEFTEKGIRLLDNEKGFFLMVEGGKIDWACHANDARAAIEEVLALDEAVKKAVDFAQSHPSETLIIVTGDHETGGMSLGTTATAYDVHPEKLGVQRISFEEFDRKIFPAYRSSHDPAPADIDSDMWSIILEYFGMDGYALSPDKEDDLSEMDIEMLEDAFDKAVHGKSVLTGKEDRLLYDVYNPLSVTLTRILNRNSGIGWSTFSHTAVPLPVFALGVGSESFDGYYDNTDIAGKIAAAMGFSVP